MRLYYIELLPTRAAAVKTMRREFNMHPSETGHRLDVLEEAFITDLRSFRAITALLKEKHLKLWGVHISDQAFANIWKETNRADLDLQFHLSTEGYTIKIDGIKIGSKDRDHYFWPHLFLEKLERSW